MKSNEVSEALEQVIEGMVLAQQSQALALIAAVKRMVPTKDGEEAKQKIQAVLAEMLEINVRVFNAIAENANDERLIELGIEFNEKLAQLNDLMARYLQMGDDEYNTPIPSEKRKSLMEKDRQSKAEDAMMKKFADAIKEFEEVIQEHPGTEVVQPMPGVLAVRHKRSAFKKMGIPKLETLVM